MIFFPFLVEKSSGWNNVGPIGSEILAVRNNEFVFGVPFAEIRFANKRASGSIILYNGNQFKIAKGGWKNTKVQSKHDPHRNDLGGSSIVKGNFKNDDKDHYAFGSPKADKLKGRVFICYDCFSKASANIDKIKGENEGARFGAALAAADLNGDGIDELIVGAPLYSSKVIF